jgi:putative transposase
MVYLAIVIDLCSRRIVGWSLADHLRADRILAAFQRALGIGSARHSIFHSDRGQPVWQHGLPAALAPSSATSRRASSRLFNSVN